MLIKEEKIIKYLGTYILRLFYLFSKLDNNNSYAHIDSQVTVQLCDIQQILNHALRQNRILS